MSANFFEWIRDGVRQSVLLGVSDAIEELGTPTQGEEIHPGVAAFLAADKGDRKRVSSATGTPQGGRKRLGKSLKEIENPSG